MKIADAAKFLATYITHPFNTGAVCPSSKYLARAMAGCVDISGREGCVVAELGAGTGAITQALVDAGFAKRTSLYSVEFDASLSGILSARFPEVKVVNDSAENLRAILGADLPKLFAVVSSLPLLSLPKPLVGKILGEVEQALPSGGLFVQYTYNLGRDPAELGFKTLKPVTCKKVFLNIPPARVDLFRKI